ARQLPAPVQRQHWAIARVAASNDLPALQTTLAPADLERSLPPIHKLTESRACQIAQAESDAVATAAAPAVRRHVFPIWQPKDSSACNTPLRRSRASRQ